MTTLGSFSTCELSDALIKLGLRNGGYIPDIEMVSPRDKSGKLSGPAFTVHIVPAEDKEAPRLEGHFVDLIDAGTVVVIDAPPHLKNAVWGGLMTAGAQHRGALGVVISGRCRDIAEHDAANFSVFARGHSTLGQSPFTRPSAVQVPVIIEPAVPVADADGHKEAHGTGCGFGPVTVRPGDWIVADLDGVVCVPKEMVDRTLEVAAAGKEVDARCLEDIKAGKGVKATFKRWRG